MVATAQPKMAAVGQKPADTFYFYMAVACALIAYLGFAPTYWLPMLRGKLEAHPVIHLHGIIFFAWSVFFVIQAWLGASRRLASHRSLGMLGVSIATAMTIFGFLAAINRMHAASALGLAEAGRSFAIVPIGAIVFFAITFAVAVANIRRPDWHKRLMLVAAVSILDAPIARWFIVALAPADAPAGPPPVAVDLGPSLVAFLLLVVAMAVDWRRIGRPHTAYLAGAAAYAVLKILQVPLSTTTAWHGIADRLMGLGS